MKKLMLLTFIFCSLALNAQDKLSLKELTKEYQTKLQLNQSQTVKFGSILEKYSVTLNNSLLND